MVLSTFFWPSLFERSPRTNLQAVLTWGIHPGRDWALTSILWVHVRTIGSFAIASFTILFLWVCTTLQKSVQVVKWRRTNRKSKILAQSSGQLSESLDPNCAVPGPLLYIYTEQLWNKTKNMSTKSFRGMTQNHRSPLPVIRGISEDGSTKKPWRFFIGKKLRCSFRRPYCSFLKLIAVFLLLPHYPSIRSL